MSKGIDTKIKAAKWIETGLEGAGTAILRRFIRAYKD